MTGIKTGKKINERSLALIQLKIFGGNLTHLSRGHIPWVYLLCLSHRITNHLL
jgi:hypothetical protein